MRKTIRRYDKKMNEKIVLAFYPPRGDVEIRQINMLELETKSCYIYLNYFHEFCARLKFNLVSDMHPFKHSVVESRMVAFRIIPQRSDTSGP